MPSVAAVGTGHYVATRSRRSPRAPMTQRATVGQSRADGDVAIDVAHAVLLVRALPLQTGEFSLEELTSPAHRPERIAVDDVHRRSRRIHIAPPRADFIQQRLVNSGFRGVGRLCVVDHLCLRHCSNQQPCRTDKVENSPLKSHTYPPRIELLLPAGLLGQATQIGITAS